MPDPAAGPKDVPADSVVSSGPTRPEMRMQVTRLLNQAVAARPTGTATLFGERRRSWQEIGDRVPRLASALEALGCGNGARVAALALNNDRYLELFFAIPWAGGAFAPLNVRWSVRENAYAIADSGAVLLFVDEHFVNAAIQLQAESSTIRHLVFMGEGETPPGMLSYEALVAAHAPIDDRDRRDDDLYVIFYTGGTTGHPKGVALSHRAIVFGAVSYLAILPTMEDLTHLYVPGFFHFAGASPVWYVTLAGGTHAILSKFDPQSTMDAIGHYRVTNINLLPTMVNMIMHHPKFGDYDLTSLQTCIYGGSPMPEALMQLAMQRLPTWRFQQVYGATETGGFATTLRWREHLHTDARSRRLKSAGQPAPGYEVRIVGSDDSPAPVGKLGEIAVRGDMLMTGYLNQPEATAAALRGGWMHTGDAGYLDEDGFLYVADRVKDMIITGGENVYSVEVERALFMHPAVREAAVIGVPDERWGERVHAIVVLKPEVSATGDELIAHCRSLIGGYKVPRSIEFRDVPLPTTPVGKVQKNVLREPFWRGRSRKI
jgi:long-chain acyl-CoA synthetase